jgi:hypothetical protein
MNTKRHASWTYAEVLKEVKKTHGVTVLTGHIGQVKRELGYEMRTLDPGKERIHSCPDRYRPWIEAAIRKLDN